jgi:hypothetical protein
MTSPIEKSFCVIEYAKRNSCTTVQRAFRKRFRTDPAPRASKQRWSDNFETQRYFCKKKSSGSHRVSDEAVLQMEATFNRRARKSVREGCCGLQMPKTTVWQVLRRRVRMKPYSATLPNRWVGRAGAVVEEGMEWPPPVSYRCRKRLCGKFCADGSA